MRCSDDGGPIRILGKTEENFREVVPELVEEAAEGDMFYSLSASQIHISRIFKDLNLESSNYIIRKWHARRY